ncbi:hypothetical protein Goari_023991 [Gossypium aridum]|uniref:Uncharacterized protein n=1 Tax=Gossypium aridum TaxID=34290 RepID=A0A7J8X591_GOSAI|nr:hypothetical protein [Gossypium aridum]
MGEEFTRLSISNDKEVLMQNQGDEDAVEEDFRLCLVGRVLTDSVVHFPSMRNTLTDLWHPLVGVSIMDIDISLRAAPRRASLEVSRWLRDDSYGSNLTRVEVRGEKSGRYLNTKFGEELQFDKECFSRAKNSRSTFGLEVMLIQRIWEFLLKYRQPLLSGLGGRNEDPQLECPWTEATMDD